MVFPTFLNLRLNFAIRRYADHTTLMDFPGGSDGKKYTFSAGDVGLIPELGRSPGGGHGNPLQYSCLDNPHGQKSLASYSPQGCKESDVTEQSAHTAL